VELRSKEGRTEDRGGGKVEVILIRVAWGVGENGSLGTRVDSRWYYYTCERATTGGESIEAESSRRSTTWICEVDRIGGRHEWQVVVICCCYCSCSSRIAFSLRMDCAPAGNPQSFHTFFSFPNPRFSATLLWLVQSVPKWKASIFCEECFRLCCNGLSRGDKFAHRFSCNWLLIIDALLGHSRSSHIRGPNVRWDFTQSGH
jgi:hypothetical protein